MKIQKMMLVLGLFVAVVSMACEEVVIEGEDFECETELDCDDSDQCTMDICTSENLCQNILIRDLPGCGICTADDDCMDEDPCTLGACEDGECVQTSSEDPECTPECDSHEHCDDGDDCTMDICGFDGQCVREDVCIEGWDLDGDGFAYPEDCDDRRVDVYPGAEEICDIIRDNDCDGEVDEDGACEYNCPTSPGYCSYVVEPNQVSISLGNLSSCNPDSPGPWRQDNAGTYVLEFLMQNLNAGDVIEQLVINQTAGVTPLPEAGAEPARAMLLLNGVLDGNSVDSFLDNITQDDDGAFRFNDLTIPVALDHSVSLIVRMNIPYTYSGYLQLGLLALDDFVVRDKVTVTQRCTSDLQLGGFYMVLCRDWDNDGHDSFFCGGDDTRDSDPTTY